MSNKNNMDVDQLTDFDKTELRTKSQIGCPNILFKHIHTYRKWLLNVLSDVKSNSILTVLRAKSVEVAGCTFIPYSSIKDWTVATLKATLAPALCVKPHPM